MERRLGRGLGSLLSKQGSEPAIGEEIQIALIRPNPVQPRKAFDPAGLEELKNSIAKHGVLQPIVLRASAEDAAGTRYELISGERRLRASKLLGKASIPAVVRSSVADDEMLELAMVENLQRRDLDPIERAMGFKHMQESLSLTQEEVAHRVGFQRSTVANHLRLLDLDPEVQTALAHGQLSMGHARALLGVPEVSDQKSMMKKVIVGDLSVRDTERMVRELGNSRKSTPLGTKKADLPWVKELEARLRTSLGTKVKLRNGGNYRGQIIVEYYDQAGLDTLLRQLAPQRSL